MSVNCDTGKKDEFEIKFYLLFEKAEHHHRRYFMGFFNEKSEAEEYLEEYLDEEYPGEFSKETIPESTKEEDVTVYAYKFTHNKKKYECKEVFYIKECKTKFNHKNHTHPEGCTCEKDEE